ncbi:MAG TPA: FUSC family protein, partial [Gammaproteobacteria bacterium]|nr:FUSC family protein [Gammaproteobacteria bacterium]
VLGVAAATLIYALVLPVDHRRRFRALNSEIVRDLQGLAAAKDLPAARRWRAQAYHRVLRLVLRAAPADVSPETVVDGGLAAVTVGTGLLRLRWLLREEQPPAGVQETIGTALAALERLGEEPAQAEAAAWEAARQLGAPAGPSAGREGARQALIEIAAALASNPAFFQGHGRR